MKYAPQCLSFSNALKKKHIEFCFEATEAANEWLKASIGMQNCQKGTEPFVLEKQMKQIMEKIQHNPQAQ